MWVVFAYEGLKEWVEIIRRCREVEVSRRVETGLESLIKFGETWGGFGRVDEGIAEQGGSVADLRDFDGVVDIYRWIEEGRASVSKCRSR